MVFHHKNCVHGSKHLPSLPQDPTSIGLEVGMYRNSKNSAPDHYDMYRTYGFQMPLFNHPIPALQIYKAILTTPREAAGQLSLTAGPELWPRIARAHTTRTKRRALRAYLRQGPLRAALRKQGLSILWIHCIY